MHGVLLLMPPETGLALPARPVPSPLLAAPPPVSEPNPVSHSPLGPCGGLPADIPSVPTCRASPSALQPRSGGYSSPPVSGGGTSRAPTSLTSPPALFSQ
eukprot:scaffold14960_cov90-Isochrysis_galbana.AAC.1